MVDIVLSNNTTGTYPYTTGYNGVDDTFLDKFNNSSNNEDNANELTINYWDATDELIGLVRFDGMSAIPGSSTLTAATLRLNRYAGSQSVADTLTIRASRRNWVVGQATWDDYATSTAWTGGGGRGTGDYSATVADTFTTEASTGWKAIASSANFLADVDDHYDGTETNNGFHLEITSDIDFQFRRYHDEGDTTNGPALSITYTAGGAETIPNGTLTLTGILAKRVVKLREKIPAHGT